MKSPIGVPLFWESRANPVIEWQMWFSTFKMAVMAKENMQVEQLLRNKTNTKRPLLSNNPIIRGKKRKFKR